MLQVRLYYVHVSRTLFGTFPIYARQFGLGGYWNGDIAVGNQISEAGCTGSGLHAMTWYDGLVDGVFNIFPRDSWWNCPNSSGFYFPCWDVSPYQLPHDLSDWEYVASW
jgi:hypothetical protein